MTLGSEPKHANGPLTSPLHICSRPLPFFLTPCAATNELPHPAKTATRDSFCQTAKLRSRTLEVVNRLPCKVDTRVTCRPGDGPTQQRARSKAVCLRRAIDFQPIIQPDSPSRKMKSQFDRDESGATAPPAAQPESDSVCSGLRLTRTHNAECSRKPSAAPE